MEKRKQNILKAVIRKYQMTALPVSSQILFRECRFRLSPATIRMEMMELDEQGYLCQPHISAGRVPTDKGYRFFIDELLEQEELNSFEEKKLEKVRGKKSVSRLNKEMAEIMALISHNFSINKKEEDFYEAGLNWLLKEPEFFNREKLVDLVDSLEKIEKMFNQMEDGLRVFIGQQNLGPKLKDCSLVVRFFPSASRNKSAVGILGPRRMNYAKNISLVEYASKILENF